MNNNTNFNLKEKNLVLKMVVIFNKIVSSRGMATNFFAFKINCFRTISNLAHKSYLL